MSAIKSIRDENKSERVLFEDKDGSIIYNNYCLECIKECKQGFKIKMFACPVKIKAHTPKQYISEISKQNRDLDKIGREIEMNSRTVKSMLYERQDMTKELYVKLEKLLYNNDLK